ncbi:MAG TPA: PH domain-containing protein [Flavobacterium sp.]|jgi:hypothetical protein
MRTFKSEKNIFLVSFLWCIIIGCITLALIVLPEEEQWFSKIVSFIILFGIPALLASALLYTRYVINGNFLYCYSGLFRSKIDINTIRKIEVNNHFMKSSALKLGLSHKGLIIYYNKFDDVFITPKDNEVFIETLLQMNPMIAIKQ